MECKNKPIFNLMNCLLFVDNYLFILYLNATFTLIPYFITQTWRLHLIPQSSLVWMLRRFYYVKFIYVLFIFQLRVYIWTDENRYENSVLVVLSNISNNIRITGLTYTNLSLCYQCFSLWIFTLNRSCRSIQSLHIPCSPNELSFLPRKLCVAVVPETLNRNI